jgi:hypothetical protein
VDDGFEDFDGEEELTGTGPGEGEHPDFRATVAAGRLTLVPWSPLLARTGPLGVMLRARGEDRVTIADLTVLDGAGGSRELVLEVVAGGPEARRAEKVLVEWARTVGHRRVWLAGRVLDLEPPADPLRPASVVCPNCRMRWSDGTADFWACVRDAGSFPRWCLLCGGDLPQWSVERGRRRARRPRQP